MFTDKQDALRRLEEALLEEEDIQSLPQPEEEPGDDELLSEQVLDELLEDERPGKTEVTYQNFSNDYGQAREDTEQINAEDFHLRPKKDNFGWIIVICLTLILGLGALIWWMLRQGGLL